MSVFQKILIIIKVNGLCDICHIIITHMKSILIPTDFSINAGYAVEYGAELAKKMNASVTLIHTFHVPIFADQVYIEETTIDNWEKDCKAKLDEMARELELKYDITVKTEVKIGFAVEEIVSPDEKFDMVVMGSRGESDLQDVFFGNVTIDVIQRSKIPVLVIPPKADYSPISNIVLACNNEEFITDNVSRVIKEFANTFSSKLYLLNIVNEYEGPVSAAYNETNKIKRHFDGIDASVNVLVENKVVTGINEFSENVNAGMVIMIPDKHTLMERMFTEIHTRHMAKIAHRPLLVVPSV